MPARLYVDLPLSPAAALALPADAARHVQVLRLQPGDAITLFNGQGGEWAAEVTRMGRQSVDVLVGAHDPVERELSCEVTLVAGMPANDRFDWLIEKATELGVSAIEPVQCERSVLRLSGERAERKREHWLGVAISAAQQCGRTRVPRIAPVRSLAQALAAEDAADGAARLLLSLGDSRPLAERLDAALPQTRQLRFYSGPEGGLSPSEEAALRTHGALGTSLGPRVLRAETAPLAVLATLASR
jgi:16S rRNA (uracil1498-N3)-methyltransferase